MKFFLTTCAAVLLAGCASAAPKPRELQTSPGDITPVMEDLLKFVNDARAANGVSSLCLNRKLTKATQDHAMDMSANGIIDTTGSDGSTPTSRAQGESFNTEGVWELVGAGYDGAEKAVQEWMSDPAYSEYILGDFKFFGAGYSYDENQFYRSFWALDFAADAGGEECA